MPEPAAHPAPAVSEQPRLFCRKCGYALVGLASRNCPECGREFDPANPRTFARRPPGILIRRWAGRAAVLLFACVLLATIWMWWLWRGWRSEQETVGKLQYVHATITKMAIGPDALEGVLGRRLNELRYRVEMLRFRNEGASGIEGIDFKSLGHLEKLDFWFCGINNAVRGSNDTARTQSNVHEP